MNTESSCSSFFYSPPGNYVLNVVQSGQISGGCNKTLLFLHQPFGGPLSAYLPAARKSRTLF